MLHAENQDRLYLIAQSEEQQNAGVGSLAFNVLRTATGWCIARAGWAPTCGFAGDGFADWGECVLDFYSEAA